MLLTKPMNIKSLLGIFDKKMMWCICHSFILFIHYLFKTSLKQLFTLRKGLKTFLGLLIF